MKAAAHANLLFAVDESIVGIWNCFFAERGAANGEQEVLAILSRLAKQVGNEKNAKIIQTELSRMNSHQNMDLPGQVQPRMKVLCPENIRTEIRDLASADNPYNKYCQSFDQRFQLCVEQYNRIAPPERSDVLDIGTGMGFLPFIFSENGHSVDAFDIPQPSDIFDGSCEILGVGKRDFSVEKYVPLLDYGRKYDVIVSTLICFNNHLGPDLWRTGEWLFFLKDLHDNQLKEDGFIWLGFNYEKPYESNPTDFLGHPEVHAIFDPFIVEPNTRPVAKLSRHQIATLI